MTERKTSTPKADRQVARVIDLLMNHAAQWDEKHWQAFLEVVQTLRSNRQALATE
jgi:hypothetical protein